MKKLVFATNNQNKLQEVREILQNKYQLIGLDELNHHEELAEDGDTFEDNARQKADFITRKFGITCFAEDTGLEIEALNGEPGIYSARYSGPQRSHADNIRLVLEKLKNQSNRKARFRTVIALTDGEKIKYFEGIVNGTISDTPKGSGGFGYDPIFIPEDYTQSFGELSAEIKNNISHRARAIRQLIEFLQENTF